MKAGRSPLVTALLVTAVLVVGCGPWDGPDGGLSEGPKEPEFDPAPGEYTEYINVEIHSNERVYFSEDPDASYLEFEPWWGGKIFVTDELFMRAFTLNDSGQRSAIVEATYTVTDPAAPIISSNGIHQDMGNTDYYGFGFSWDIAFPENGEPNPSDDLTDWYELEVSVFSSFQDNISTIEDAETNGTIIRDWSPVSDSYAYCDTSRAGERRYVNVFVRDEHNNVAAYGTVRMASQEGPKDDIYLGRSTFPGPPEDQVWLHSVDEGVFDPEYYPAMAPVPPVLQDTKSVALADLNDDGYDDLVVCYRDGPEVYQGWFAALGNGSFSPDPSYVVDSTNGADDAYDIAVADMNLDGSLDLIFANISTDVTVYNSDMTVLMTVPTVNIDSIATGDINGDGYPDLVTADSSFAAGGVDTWVNEEGADLIAVAQSWYGDIQQPNDIALADLNRDGKADLIVAQQIATERVEIFYGSADGELIEEDSVSDGEDESNWWVYEHTEQILPVDWNNDGWLDLLFVNNVNQFPNIDTRLHICLGDTDVYDSNLDGSPDFEPTAMSFPFGATSLGGAILDVNSDGWMDFIEYYVGMPARLWLNNSGSGRTIGSFPLGMGDETAIAVGTLR